MFKVNPLTTNVPHHIETSQLICTADQLTGFYMMGTFIVNGLTWSLFSKSRMRFLTLQNAHILLEMNWDLSHGTFALLGMELKQLLLLAPRYGAICPVN